MASIDEVEEIIDGLLKLQDKIIRKEKWISEEAVEDVGNVAHIEVYSVFGSYSTRLKLDKGLRIVKTNEKPLHVIRMHIDTFLDLLTGTLDFGEAWARGLIEFDGDNYHVHAMKWARAFKRLRKYIVLPKGGGR